MHSAPSRRDAILAQATPRGAGERAILRLSCPDLRRRWSELLPPRCPRPAAAPQREVLAGELEWAPGARLPVTLWVFPGPASATGEDLLELHLPGAQPVVDLVMADMVERGARLAEPGEFTRRAFLNGKLDLLQAEAVLDLVQARSAESASAATRILAGALGRDAARAREALTRAQLEIESGLDFEEGDSQDLAPAEIGGWLAEAAAALHSGWSSEQQRAARSRGEFRILLRGAPSAGKSSLFRALTGAEALVSATPGTTRDRLEAAWPAAGADLPWIVMDGPGVGFRPQDPQDEAAQQRAQSDPESADLVFLCVDSSDPAARIPDPPAGLPALVILTKSDLPPAAAAVTAARGSGLPAVALSAATREGFAELERATAAILHQAGAAQAARLASALRHERALRAAAEAVTRARLLHDQQGPQDLVAEELRAAGQALAELAGDLTPEDLLDRLFAQFCVGK
jgi:tRNA modification GTPase